METLWTRYDRWGQFPDTVNERAARLVALGVAMLALGAVLSGALWIAPLLFAGFLLRVWQGPRLDPLGRLAVWTAPRLFPEKVVSGPPKRFAQLLGATLTGLASLALLGGVPAITTGALVVLFLLASLESLGGVCLGCHIFGWMIRRGWVPESICERCVGSS